MVGMNSHPRFNTQDGLYKPIGAKREEAFAHFGAGWCSHSKSGA